jgi:MFS family permease
VGHQDKKERKMKTTNKITAMKDRKVILSTLWIFALFNYVYADILTLYFNPALQKEAWKQFLSGYVGSIHITQGFVLVGAILMETAIAMVLLSRILPYRANRWTNIIVGILQTASVAWSMTGPLYWNLFYVFFATIEIACTLFIVWYAWTWPRPESGVLTGADSELLNARQNEQEEAKRQDEAGSKDAQVAGHVSDTRPIK